MRVLVVGATGAVGRPLIKQLAANGHVPVAMVRSYNKIHVFEGEQVEVVEADLFDDAALTRALGIASAEVVVHMATAVPRRLRPRHIAHDLELTNRLRTDGTRRLIAAARAAGAQHIIAQSSAFAFQPVPGQLATEDTPLYEAGPASMRPMVKALLDLEAQVSGAEIKGTVLRFGVFCGPGTAYALDGSVAEAVRERRVPVASGARGAFSFIHTSDAAHSVVSAIEARKAGVFNIVNDHPAPFNEWVPQYARMLGAPPPRTLPSWLMRVGAGSYASYLAFDQPGVSNHRARNELAWRPRYLHWRDGFSS